MANHHLVFDYTAGTPWVTNQAIDTALEAALNEGRSPSAVYADEEIRQLRTNESFREKYKETYLATGVDVLSVTLSDRSSGLSYGAGFWRDFARWLARFELLDWMRPVTSPKTLQEVAQSDDVGIVLNTQNLGEVISEKGTRIEDLYNAGLRIMQLTYNSQNGLGTGCTDRSNGGLSLAGREAVSTMNDFGVIVDLSHCGLQTSLDAIEYSNKPVAFTHTSCASIAQHDRAKTDEELEAIAENDGYVGIYMVPPFAAPDMKNVELERFFEHLDYAIERVGSHRVGIGTDFGHSDIDCPEPIQTEILETFEQVGFRAEHGVQRIGTGFGAFSRYTDWPHLVEELESRYSQGTVSGILGGNFSRFWCRVAN